MPQPVDVEVRDGTIRLGQLLKLADMVGSGADAKDVLAAGGVRVNGEVETRRGRQLRSGDVVTSGSSSARVQTAGQPTSRPADEVGRG